MQVAIAVNRNLHVDIHAHFYPEAYLKLLSEEGAPLLKGRSPLPLDPWFTDLDARRKEMDRQGVQVHVLSLTPGGPELHESAGYYPMAYWVDGELGLRLAQAMNDAMAEAHTAFPDRLLGLATIPLQSPALARQAWRRAATRRAAGPSSRCTRRKMAAVTAARPVAQISASTRAPRTD